MALFGRVVDGVLEQVGALPETSTRLDTLDVVRTVDWMAATGWHDLATVNPATLTDDPDKLEALTTAIAQALAKAGRRQALNTQRAAITELTRSVAWDWIDSNCHPTVANYPLVQEQSPNAGTVAPAWGSLSTLDKAEALRLAASEMWVILIRFSQGFDLIFDGLADLFAAADVDPPDPR